MNKLTIHDDKSYTIYKAHNRNSYWVYSKKAGVLDVNLLHKIVSERNGRQLIFKWAIFNKYKLYEISAYNGGYGIRILNNTWQSNKKYSKSFGSSFICNECEVLHQAKGLEYDDNFYCPNCYNKLFFECVNCGDKGLKDEALKHDGDCYCESCHDEQFFSCENCCNVYSIDEMSYTEEGSYCQDCFDELFSKCYHCGELVKSIHCYRGADDNEYCANCYNEHFATCEECGGDFLRDDMYYGEDDDLIYCEDCYNENSNIRRGGHKPEPKLQRDEATEPSFNTLFLGFELEVEIDGSRKDKAEEFLSFLKQKNIGDRFYLKEDGSLDCGFEIVSHPATLKAYHSKHKLHEIIKFLKDDNEITSYSNENCGLHIHVNRSYLTAKEINKIQLFFANNDEVIEKFSKRHGKRSFCHHNDFNKTDYKLGASKENAMETDGRYYAINTTNLNTVEFRIFRGTLHYKRFLATLQFVDAVCHYVKMASFQGMTWEKFMIYLRMANRYCHLVKYLEAQGIA